MVWPLMSPACHRVMAPDRRIGGYRCHLLEVNFSCSSTFEADILTRNGKEISAVFVGEHVVKLVETRPRYATQTQ